MTLNILVLEPPILSNVGYWRLWLPFEVIRKMYRAAPVNFKFTFKRKEITYFDIWESDLIVLSRPGSLPDLQEVLDKAKEIGKPIIIDLDDDILSLPDIHPLFHSYKKGSKGYKRAIKAMDCANLFWYSTEKFMENYPKHGVVIPNAIPDKWLPNEPAPDRGLWVWRGRDIQLHDLMQVGRAWYEEIKSKPEKWVFMGSKPPLDHGDNVESVGFVDDVEKYLLEWRRSGFNGIWKPMIDCRFNDHKSNISVIEAAMGGGVCLTNYAGKPGWEYATKEFPNYKTAVKLWEKSRTAIAEQYNLLKWAQVRAETMAAICLPQVNTSQPTAETSNVQ